MFSITLVKIYSLNILEKSSAILATRLPSSLIWILDGSIMNYTSTILIAGAIFPL